MSARYYSELSDLPTAMVQAVSWAALKAATQYQGERINAVAMLRTAFVDMSEGDRLSIRLAVLLIKEAEWIIARETKH